VITMKVSVYNLSSKKLFQNFLNNFMLSTLLL
jgi:hypothetical protein